MGSMTDKATEFIDGQEEGQEVSLSLMQEHWGDEFILVEASEADGLRETRSVTVPAREFFDAVRRLELERK